MFRLSEKGDARRKKVLGQIGSCCSVLALPLIGFSIKWLLSPCSVQHIVGEPEGLADQLLQLPRYALSEQERLSFENDGIVVVPGQMKHDAIVRQISAAVWKGGIPPFNSSLTNQWVTNGVLRALVRDGPFGSLAASVLNTTSVRVANTAAFFKKKVRVPEPSQRWHVDDHLTERSEWPMITIWIALTDAPESLEILLGSHNVAHDCPYYASPTDNVEQDCIQNQFAGKVGKSRGRSALSKFSFKAGDVAIMHGKVWHRGHSHLKRRLAIALRFVPGDMHFEREFTKDISRSYYHKFLPDECSILSGPLFPMVHPRQENEFNKLQWPLRLTWGEFLLARLWRIAYELRILTGQPLFMECRETVDGRN